ncbi:MAG: murein biosynthesis integral membrane protein MurJ [Verrucomicrobia bacterium]|nr:murein biosynthesis integral membrane protein MurJ [Verrucomicrobiota bacterium]
MQYRSVLKSASLVGFFILISRLFGLVRDVVFAHYFGTSLAKSAFDVAFRIPNLFRRLFGEGALSASFIPVFTESLEKDTREEAWKLASRVRSMLVTVLAAIVMAGMAVVWLVLRYGHFDERAFLTLSLLQLMLPYAMFICVVALCMAVLNSFKHFAVPAATPIILNLVLIASMVWVCPWFGTSAEERIFGVAWGVVAAGLIQMFVQYPALKKFGFTSMFSFNWRDSRVGKVLLLMLPASVGMGITQINVVVGGVLALWAGAWAPAALTYAEHMVYLPLGLFATSLGTVLLPTFSTFAARNQTDEINRTINSALRHLMFIMIPAAVGLAVLAEPIIRLLLERGAFNEQSTMLTARALQFYAPGLFAFSLCKIFAPAFYSMKDTTTPVKVGICAIALNFALNVTGIVYLPELYKHAAIALGSVIAETVNGCLLAWLLQRKIGSPGWREITSSLFRTLICAAIMGVCVFGANAYLGDFSKGVHAHLWLRQLVVVVACIATGAAVYAGAVMIFCRKEVRELMTLRRHKEPAPRQDPPCRQDGQ